MHTQQINRNQPGDPDKAATAMIDIAGVANPPLRLALGEDAYALIHAKIDALRAGAGAVEGRDGIYKPVGFFFFAIPDGYRG